MTVKFAPDHTFVCAVCGKEDKIVPKNYPDAIVQFLKVSKHVCVPKKKVKE